jgi:hypothetical protein
MTSIVTLGRSISALESAAAAARARIASAPTQVLCPSPPSGGSPPIGGTAPPVTLPDRRAPLVTGAALTSSRFTVGPDATAVAAQARRGGTTVRWSVDEPATTTFAIARTLPGRRSGRRCVRPTRRLRRARRCTRIVARGTLRRRTAAGRNSLRFSGRIGRRALPRGTYQMVIVATDAAGNRSAPRTLRFTVVRAPRRR